MAYSREDKERVYREWANQGFPPLWPFTNWLNKQIKANHEDFAWLEKVPTDVTLKAWYKEEDWEQRALEEQKRIREALTQEAVQLKQEMFQELKKSALAKIRAQEQVFQAAKLDELEEKEARMLLEAAQDMGQSGIRDMREALLLVGESVSGEVSKPALGELLGGLDEIFGGVGSELKIAMAAQLKPKDADVVEGSFVEIEEDKKKIED